MKQFVVTTAMGKRLIGKGMAAHPAVERVLEKGRLAIIAGTTNGYVAEEVLERLGQREGFTRAGFRRGITVAPGRKAASADFPGDVIIVDGRWQRGLSIVEVAEANAFDARGKAAVQIGNPRGGTILDAMPAVIGQRARLIVPVGLEKRVLEDVHDLAQRCNAPGAEGPRLYVLPGEIFTELDAIRLLTGAEPFLLAAGGVHGAEGAAWLGIDGDDEQVEAAAALIRSVSREPPCEA
jgi:hypothetical protein